MLLPLCVSTCVTQSSSVPAPCPCLHSVQLGYNGYGLSPKLFCRCGHSRHHHHCRTEDVIFFRHTVQGRCDAVLKCGICSVILDPSSGVPFLRDFADFREKWKSRFRETHIRSAKKTCGTSKNLVKKSFCGSRLHQIDF